MLSKRWITVAVWLTALAVASGGVAGAAGSSAPAQSPETDDPTVPAECVFSTGFERSRIESDDPGIYGLSTESIKLQAEAERSKVDHVGDPKPAPSNAQQWGGMTVTREDADRLQRMADIYRDRIMDVRRSAVAIFGERFTGVTWSYVDGFRISVVGGATVSDQARVSESLGDAPVTFGRGLFSSATLRENLDSLADLGRVGLLAQGDESCGMTFVSFTHDPMSQAELERVLPADSFRIVPPDFFQDESAELAVGKRERKGTLAGGLKIWSSGLGESSWCTSNVVARKGSTERWMLTAAHCAVGTGTISGSAGTVSTVFGSNWHQGFATEANTRFSLGTTQYLVFGGNHDILAIQMDTSRTPSHLVHSVTFPTYDAYVDPAWWYWNLGFESQGLGICQSGYTRGEMECGTVWTTNFVRTWTTAQGAPFNATVSNLRTSLNMDVCNGDSGGTVWAQGNDDNIAGIVHARLTADFTQTREGTTFNCGNSAYTGISSLGSIGLTAPWGMS